MKTRLSFIIILLLTSGIMFAQQPINLVKYVNTRQGTNSKYEFSYGNTYPATTLPFGMNTWTAQNSINGDGWKYQYFKDTIRGFQQSHQCSSWVNDYAVFSLMPVTGKLEVNQYKRAAKFSHVNEIAQPSYYKVTLNNNITTEMTPTERGVHLRFKFPKGKDSYIVLDGYTKMSKVSINLTERKITGYVNNCRWAPKNFKNFFIIIFDKPFTDYGTWENKKDQLSPQNLTAEGEGVGAYIKFKNGETVTAKVASSYISPEQAELTLQTELGHYKNFEDTHKAADKVWNDLLGRLLVEGGTEEEKATFYSCVYHANLFSHQFFEYGKDGKPYYYSPYDGNIHNGYMYTDNGFWDTFRAQFPLNTIIHPKMEGQYCQALLDAQQQCGWLPSWSFPGETGGMLGNHSISILTDAWVKGIHTFDSAKALAAYYHEATNKGPWGSANGRPGSREYFVDGYVPYSQQTQGATSWTLEFAYDDFCGYQLAKQTGNTFYENVFGRQMYNYKNLYDSKTRFMRAKDATGNWIEPFDPLEWGGPYTEGNAWHWTWSVFQDVQGLINLMGGDKNFIAKLDSVFTMPGTIKVGGYKTVIHEMTEMAAFKMGQYAQGNEPIHHMIYLYNYAGQPWKAQQHIREVMDKMYNATENGYPGDEDEGQMSSWYVLSAAGIYSVCPGTDQYVIGSPVFKKITITLENGNKFTVEANNNSKQNVYIQSATLNGKAYTHNFITHSDIMNGGVLHLEMGDKPALNRGLALEDKPFSLSKQTQPN
jgi:predicted alpha-1,2-mannosidase